MCPNNPPIYDFLKGDNPWWDDPRWCHAGVERNIFKYLSANRDDVSILVIKGPISSGKTFLLKQFVSFLLSENINPENIVYLDMHNAEVRKEFEKGFDFFSFAQTYREKEERKIYFLLDHLEEVANGNVVAMLASQTRFKMIMVYSFETAALQKTAGELAGRTTTFRLSPFSFKEFLFSKTQDNEILQKLHNLETLVRFLVIDPHEIFHEMSGFYEQNPNLFNFIDKHFLEYAVYGGYPKVVFRDPAANAFDAIFFVIKNSMGMVPKGDFALEPNIQAYVTLLEKIAKGELALPDYEAGELQINLAHAFLIAPLKAFHHSREMRALMPVRFVLTDHGMRNVLTGYDTLQRARKQILTLLDHLLVNQMMKFLYFDEMKSKELYYLLAEGQTFYRYVFCDDLNNVYPMGFVSDEDIGRYPEKADPMTTHGILFTTGSMKKLASRNKRVFLLPYLILAGI